PTGCSAASSTTARRPNSTSSAPRAGNWSRSCNPTTRTPCGCSSRRRVEMRSLQSLLLMLLLCLPAAVPAMAAEGEGHADAVATATHLLDHMRAGDYAAATADFRAQMKDALGPGKLAAVRAHLAAHGEGRGRDQAALCEPSRPHAAG